ncbi:CD99 molecule isoform X3 [Tachysurus vachellii]|uniref:CD99 molecule isoform X2 n=1 Tax=Tachysurus vachellii TaxID=175792 RepID=UPI00296ADB39|nr:CD99 molecule isoform X2 [Tachysurus vachellii]XP_060716176.1 CD99 molecule isoform X3 [Tachysurus vachellii]
MTYYLWIVLFGALLITKAQELDLLDALSDENDPPPKTEKPPKPAGGGELDLADAVPSDPKQPVVPPKSEDPKQPVVPPQSGGGFSDDDLLDGKNPDASQVDYSDDAHNDQPKAAEGGQMAGIISAVAVAIFGAASSYFAYQKKKLCFKVQGGTDPESGRNQSGTQSDPQAFSNLLRSS